MSNKDRMSGNEAVSVALRQINPDVFPAFPITPSTEIPQYFSKIIADGQADTVFIPVESEHSSMSACIGSEAAGARTMTATSSCGLSLMAEMLYVASSLRLPIILACVNRALTGPININADHSDSMGVRDSGWIQLYSENNQEVYDNFIQAVRIAEHRDVHLPVMVCQDGFITSHAVENIELNDDEEVYNFVGEYKPEHYLLNPDEQIALGPYDTANFYIEHKRLQAQAMINAKNVIKEIAAEYEKLTGRSYGFFEEYEMADAEIAVVLLNSSAGTAKAAINSLRARGVKAGLVKIRIFRPFPAEELAEVLLRVKAVAVMDKSEGFSATGGPVFHEVRSALYGRSESPAVINYIYGLGGRDLTTDHVEFIFSELAEIESGKNTGDTYRYLGVRE